MHIRTVSLAALLTMVAATPITILAQDGDNPPGSSSGTSTTVTNATGSITQVNYDPNGEVAGFLVGSSTLLEFPTNVSGGVATLGAVGNSVTYSGTAFTTTSTTFTTVRVTSFTNNTTKATYSPSTATPTPTAYGPTSGTVTQVNYAEDGSIDGFVFKTASASVFVSTGNAASATLKPLLTAGATVSVTGTAAPNLGATCTTTGGLTAVHATSLTIGSQTIVIAGGGFGGEFPGGGRGPHR